MTCFNRSTPLSGNRVMSFATEARRHRDHSATEAQRHRENPIFLGVSVNLRDRSSLSLGVSVAVLRADSALAMWAAIAGRAFGADLGAPAAAESRVRDAIVNALQHRMGSGVKFEVTDLVPTISGPIDGPLAVTFDASARLGGRIRFLLT